MPERDRATMVVPGVVARELVFVTGKGGVGKTTVATALALAAVEGGRRSLVCELSAQTRVTTAFGRAPASANREVELAPRLATVSIDPDAALAEWLARNVGRAAAAVLGRSGAFDHLVAAAPGARELVTIGKAWDLSAADEDRLVVVDAPASGHAIALLQAPSTFSHLGAKGPIGHQAADVHAFFADPDRSAVVLVCTPAELPVSETIELAARIEEVTGRPVDAVVANEVLPDRFDDEELDLIDHALGSGNAVLRAAGRDARRAWRRARTQEDQLERLRGSVDTPIVELPFVFAPALGPAELRMLARELSARR
jgi:anion-transporting  ArsA/GET3 family ATPase